MTERDPNRKQQRKIQFFTKYDGPKPTAMAHVPKDSNQITITKQNDSCLNDGKIYEKGNKKGNVGTLDHVESSYRIFNDLVNKAHERRLEQMEIKK